MAPRDEYARRIHSWAAVVARHERTYLWTSNLRLAVAGAGAIVLWLVAIPATIAVSWLIAPAVIFLVLVVVHARIAERLERARRSRRFYERGVDRLEHRWAGTGRDGSAFLDDTHLYARDLDLFGRGSLYELINTTVTQAGEETLAGWLLAPAEPQAIAQRHAAIDELRGRLDLREQIAVTGAEAHVGRTTALATWAGAPAVEISAAAAFVFAACAAITAVWLAVILWRDAGWSRLIAWLIVQAAIVSIWRRKVNAVVHRLADAAHDLNFMRALVARIEREAFTSPRLAELQAALHAGGVAPSRRIAQLDRLVSLLESTENKLFAPVAAMFAVRSQAAAAIDRWHAAHGAAIVRWIAVLGELEALSALATYAYEHPADPFPTIVEGGPVFAAQRLAHPLIPDAASVRNDVRLGDDAAHVLIVSGSNMSGKTTLLRAVGVNTVLALAGAPVRAASLRVSSLAIGATLRVQDSLLAGQSHFFAEILRIRAIVEAARGATPVLFLLDEILHGTNSYDRRIGADAIVRALVARNAIGLVTTHDLALTECVAALGPLAANVHFEDRIEQGAMTFDYRMRPGIVEHSNALALMRQIGLEV